jgi:hypothetical protein
VANEAGILAVHKALHTLFDVFVGKRSACKRSTNG